MCQCTDRLSARQNCQGAAEGFSTLQESNPCCPTLCNQSYSLSLWFVSMAWKISFMTDNDLLYFTTCNKYFCIQDWHTWIFQVKYQGQIRNTRILGRRPLMYTSYCIQHRLEIFFLAQFCSMLIEQLINLEKVKTDNLKIELWMVGQ